VYRWDIPHVTQRHHREHLWSWKVRWGKSLFVTNTVHFVSYLQFYLFWRYDCSKCDIIYKDPAFKWVNLLIWSVDTSVFILGCCKVLKQFGKSQFNNRVERFMPSVCVAFSKLKLRFISALWNRWTYKSVYIKNKNH
jgi:hypothetical protein